MQGKIKSLSKDILTGENIITLATNGENDLKNVESLQGNKLDISLTKHREKRSLNANNYYWELLGQLANVLGTSQTDLHYDMLRNYGSGIVISVEENIDISPYVRYFEEIGRGVVNGKNFIHYKQYKGSSEMNTKEMATLIDGLVSECQEQGIETMTPEELQSLKESWK